MEISLIFNTVSHRQNISMGYFIGKKVTDKQTNSNFINIDLQKMILDNFESGHYPFCVNSFLMGSCMDIYLGHLIN